MMLVIAFIFALLLRLVLAATTYHPDLSVFVFASKLIVLDGHWLNFYDYSVHYVNGVATLFPHGMVLNYQPLAYLIPSLIYLPFTYILRHTADPIINSTWNHSTIYLPLLVYKLPLILADIAIFFSIPRLFTTTKNKKLSQIIWAFNPLAIYVSSMIGQVDIIITLFILWGLISLKRGQFNRTALFFALSALIKPAALILLPLVAVYLFVKKNYFNAIANFATGLITYLLGISIYLPSPIYRYYALFADQLTKSTHAGISVASGHDIPWFFIVLAIIVALIVYKKIMIFPALGAALFSSLTFTHFHPQWLLWITPWFIYFAIQSKKFMPLLFLYLSWKVIVFAFDSSLHLGLFYTMNLPKISLLSFGSPFLQEIVSAARAWFVAYLFVILFVHGKPTKNKTF
jgi:hypothetical protein